MVLIVSENDSLSNMNNYEEKITTSLENSRNSLRRIARNDDTEFSHQSIFNVLEKFVKTVNSMDETILVPCRLMDRKVGDELETCGASKGAPTSKNVVQEVFRSTDLFQIYNMLNSVKDSLLWGQTQELVKATSSSTNSSQGCFKFGSQFPSPTTTEVKGHVRRPSTVSVSSTNSTASTMSDTESEGSSNETDSGIEETEKEECQPERVAHDFRRHLYGLTSSLRQMTEAAQYLIWRYQHDIGGPV